MVSGVAGLIWSKYPHYTAAQVKAHIIATADDLGAPGRDDYYGHGRVNAHNAVKTVYVPESYSTLQDALNAIHPDDNIVVTSGTHTVNSQLVLTGDGTLSLHSGVVVYLNGGAAIGGLTTNNAILNFPAGKGLVINGKANCQNSTFTGGYRWNGIVVNSSTNFTNNTIVNAVTGLTITNASYLQGK
jgi:hypothetical protein